MTAAVARFVGTPGAHVVDLETLREKPPRPAEPSVWPAVRRDVETVTNRLASRPCRRLSTVERDGLVTASRRLADLDQEDLPLP